MELLVVDDERTAIEAVKNGICWKNLSFTRIHTAMNIREAKAILEEYTVQVLLCDIEMPAGSGLELLEWIVEMQRETCCIFMTCHADFFYAQQALRLGSFEYVLKPLDFQKLEVILKAAILKVKQQKDLRQTKEYLEKSKKAMTQQFWRNLFIGNISPDEKSIQAHIINDKLDISLEGSFLPVLISPYGLSEDMSNEERRIYGFALRNVISEIFSESGKRNDLEVLSNDKVLVVLNVSKEINEKEVQREIGICCQKLIRAVNQYFHIQICCYVGDKGIVSEIPEQLEKLLKMDLNNIIYVKMVVFSNLSKAIFTEEYAKADYLLDAYRKYPDDYGKILEEIQTALDSRSSFMKDEYFIYHFFMGMYFLLDQYSTKKNVFLRSVIDDEKNWRLLMAAPNSMKELQEWLQYIKDIVVRYETQGVAVHSISDEVKSYIHANLDLELSAERVAQQVSFNVDYLNRVFKKENGTSLNKYILQEKMERAKWLLRHTDWQIGEVAAAVGYYNYSSFYRSFSKQVGKSPQEYKEEK